MRYTFTWMFSPSGHFVSAHDEFCIGPIRVRLQGDLVVIQTDASTEEEAEAAAIDVAKKYSEALSKYTGLPIPLFPLNEFSSRPLQYIFHPSSPEELRRLADAIRRVRNELLVPDKEQMRSCYDYLQDALENEETSLYFLYKLTETVEHLLGGEREAGRILRVTQELKTIKRLANEPYRNERHAPEPHEPVLPLSEADRIKAVECGRRILRALERNLLKCPDSTEAV